MIGRLVVVLCLCSCAGPAPDPKIAEELSVCRKELNSMKEKIAAEDKEMKAQAARVLDGEALENAQRFLAIAREARAYIVQHAMFLERGMRASKAISPTEHIFNEQGEVNVEIEPRVLWWLGHSEWPKFYGSKDPQKTFEHVMNAGGVSAQAAKYILNYKCLPKDGCPGGPSPK